MNNKFPEEILNLVFEGLSVHDLYECQRVCRAWKERAKLLLLENVSILNRFDLRQFLTSFNVNPHPSYLNAVKKISIGDPTMHRSAIPFDIAQIKRLLLRMPLLKHIVIYDTQLIYELLDDEFCKDLSLHCKQLRSCTIGIGSSLSRQTSTAYYESLYKLRHVLKYVNLSAFPLDDPITYLTEFAHLEEAKSDMLLDLQAWLPFFKRYAGLERLTCTVDQGTYDVENGETAGNLTKLRELSLVSVINGIDAKAVDFLRRYVTGLSKFSLLIMNYIHWDELGQSAFCQQLLDFACRLDYFSIKINLMSQDVLSDCIQPVFQKVFQQSRKNNTLHLYLKNWDSGTSLDITSTRSRRTIRISHFVKYLENLLEAIFPTDNVDTLLFQPCRDQSWTKRTIPIFATLAKLLDGLPSLNKLILDTPFLYDNNLLCTRKQYPRMAHLQLNASKDMQTKGTLGEYITMFPNLKYLKLHYFSGLWNKETYEYQINLDDWNLERMNVDVTPLRVRTGETLRRPTTLAEAYFVLEVNITQSRQRYMYKVSLDCMRLTKIEDEDIEDQKCGEDYVRLHITISNLEYLDLHMYRKILEHNSFVKYFEEHDQDIMNVKLSFVQ